MLSLIVYPNANQIKHDAVGAFIPEAQLFRKYHTKINPEAVIDEFQFNPKEKNKEEFFAALMAKPYDSLFIFSHGLPDRLPQLEISNSDAQAFADSFASNEPLVISLYCCLVAKLLMTPNFCHELGAALARNGKRFDLYGHRTAGHTTANPNISQYNEKGLTASYPLCLKNFEKKFIKQMRTQNDAMRFMFPFAFRTERG